MLEDTLTVKETAVLAEISERAVRTEIERDVVRPASRAGGHVRLPAAALYYFNLIRHLDVDLSRSDRRAVYRLLVTRRDRERDWQRVDDDLRKGLVLIRFASVREASDRCLAMYRRGRRRVRRDQRVLGGEPVFAGTRISVRHIGLLAAKMTDEDIVRHYPALTRDDVAYAKLFAAMAPGPGRPRKRLRFRRAPA